MADPDPRLGFVGVDVSGHIVSGEGMAWDVAQGLLYAHPLEAQPVVGPSVASTAMGLAEAILKWIPPGDGIDASTTQALAESRACSLELAPGGTELFSGALNSSQGIAWVSIDGEPNLFLAIRTIGTAYTSSELIRIVRFRYAGDGRTLTPVHWSEELQIGHGQSLTAFADDDGNVTLYCSVYSGDTGGVSVQKGFTRIRWRGDSTSQDDVDEIIVLPDDDAGEEFSRYHSVTPCVSSDQKKLLLSANDTEKDDSSHPILVYDLERVLAEFDGGGDPTTIAPIAIIPRPALSQEGHLTQGMAATAERIYTVTGYYQPLGEKTVIVSDYAGNVVKTIPLALSLNNYSLGQLLDHPAFGIPYQFEPEDLTLTDDGEILVCCCESWLESSDVVTFGTRNFAAIRAASGVDESPRDDRLWVPTEKTAAQGTWSPSSSYAPGSTKSRVAKEVWRLAAAPTGGAAAAEVNAHRYCPRSGAPLITGRSNVDLSYPVGQDFQIKAWSANTQEYLRSFEISRRGMQIHDTRPGSDNQYLFLAVENIDGREYSYLRANGGDLSWGSGINLYGGDDSVHPHAIYLFQGDSTAWVGLEDGAWQGGDATLGDSSNPWSESHVEVSYWYGHSTPEIGSTSDANRYYMYIRADGVVANGGGINLYGSSDSTHPNAVSLLQGSSSVAVYLENAEFWSTTATLGSSSHVWPEVHTNEAYVIGNATAVIGSVTTSGRYQAFFRADDEENSAEVALYGNQDANTPGAVVLHHGGGAYLVALVNGVFRGGGDPVMLGDSSHRWPVAWIDLVRLTPTLVSSLPTASSYTGGVAYCSNGDSGSPCLAVSNGSSWLRVPLGSAVSAS